MRFLSDLRNFEAGQRNQRHRYQVAPDEIEQIERLITDGDFKGLIKKSVSVTVNGKKNQDERYALEIIGACIAGAGNKGSQIRRIFNDFKLIQQRIEAYPAQKSPPDLERLRTEVQQTIDTSADANKLLETLERLIERYETAEPVQDEIELSLALVLSKIRYGSDKLRGIAVPFLENLIKTAVNTPTLKTFQSLIKAVEVTYAYFYPLASKED